MKRSFLLSVCMALMVSSLGAADIWSRTAWSGGSGPSGLVIDPIDPFILPVRGFEGEVTGRLTLRFRPPRARSNQGTYTAQLVLREGSATRTYRGRGTVAADGTINEQVWRSRAAGTQVSVTLRRPLGDPSILYLVGQVQAAGGIYPLFALPHVFDARQSPLEGEAATGRFNAFLRDPLQNQGTGTGSARISAGGAVRLSATLGDLRRFTARGTVLSAGDGTRFFLAAQPVRGGGFFGGWFALDPARPDADWAGRAFSAASVSPQLDVFLSLYTRPARGTNVLPWTTGIIDLDAPQVEGSASQVATGEVAWRNPLRLAALERPDGSAPQAPPQISSTGQLNLANAFNVRLLNLSIAPATGRATGRMRYFYFKSSALSSTVAETPHITTMVGAVNQKSGQIEGLVRPRVRGGSTGLLLVSPQAD